MITVGTTVYYGNKRDFLFAEGQTYREARQELFRKIDELTNQLKLVVWVIYTLVAVVAFAAVGLTTGSRPSTLTALLVGLPMIYVSAHNNERRQAWVEERRNHIQWA